MLLHAAFFPPHEVVAELAEVVRSVAGRHEEFRPVSVDDMHVHVTSFGNLARADAARLADRLVVAAAGWPPAPRLAMAGCSALAFAIRRSKASPRLTDLRSKCAKFSTVPAPTSPPECAKCNFNLV